MTTFLTTMLVFTIIGLSQSSHNLSGSYPRQSTTDRTTDLISLAIQIGMLVWIINLLLVQA